MKDNLETLPPLRDVISEHGLRAEKSLGQNFLLDQNITDKIVRQSGDLSGYTVIEIGPGPGGLTRSLLRGGAKHVVAVEFDPRAVHALEDLKNVAQGRLEILQADALNSNLLEFVPEGPRKIIANLPYNIATPLLIGWLKQIKADQNSYASMNLMFQKEVAERIVAQPNSKAYGRLSVISQWLCDVKILFDLPAAAFTPPPKVKSSVVQFVPKKLSADDPDFKTVEAIVSEAFGQRRKMLRSSLKGYAEFFKDAGIQETNRAEDLSVEQFLKLAQIARL